MKRFMVLFLFLIIPLSLFAAPKELRIYTWSDYFDQAVIKQFEKESGVKVILGTYDNNEEMFDEIKKKGAKNYDVAFPSTYFLDRMARLGMLQPLDHSKLPNMKNMNKALLNKPYDPKNTYSTPYMWGSTAIAVNTKKINPAGIKSWNALWNPAFKGRVFLMDDVREVFGMGLRSSAFSGNDTNPEHIKTAYDKLLKLMPGVKVMSSEKPGEYFRKNLVDIGMIWSSEIFTMSDTHPHIKYIFPDEGAIFWVDSIVIPKGAQNLDSAHLFINFMMKPDVAKKNSEYTGCATANQSAVSLLDKKIQNNKTVYPDPTDLVRGEFQTDVGNAISLYEKYWESLKKEQKGKK